MRRFAVEVVVNAVILVLIAFVLTLIVVPQPFPFGESSAPILDLRDPGLVGFVVWAGVLVLVNRFARPVIMAVTGQLLFRTMGLFVVVVNAIAIWVTSILSPIKIAYVAQPFILWLLVAATLWTIVSTVTTAVLGLNRPSFGPERERSLWRSLEALPTPRRNAIIENLRLQQVYDAIYANSLDIALAGTPIGDLRTWFERRVLGQTDPLSGESGPVRVRLMLQQLGPTYVKIGQMMASRSDLLPPVWIDELSKLQSDAAPFGWEDASEILTKELGRPPEELYASIEHEPFAAASTA